jgi:hypothetical protein
MKLIYLNLSVLFVFWYHSPNFLDTPRADGIMRTMCKYLTADICLTANKKA